ncbi:MAG: hypothetical protein EOP53_07715 [Sphingobacteriales bacterium]|nr:MAG: hypothetical protein EOP53_07715 [Sphingobacteriales bacterium]
MECGLYIWNDCDLVNNNYLSGYTVAAVYPGPMGTYALPCSRIDEVSYGASSGNTPSQCATVLGSYIGCSGFPFGFQPTTTNQVEYREVDHPSSLLWDDQTSIPKYGEDINPPYAANTQEINPYIGGVWLRDIYQGNSATGWLVRYRNNYTGCSNVSRPWTTGTYMTEYHFN